MIVVDVETTGVNPWKHSLVSIGAVDFSNPKNQFYGECRIWDGALTMNESLAINGFSESDIRDTKKMPEYELVQSFFEWMRTSSSDVIAGMNPSFDRDFLKAAAQRAHLKYPFGHRTVDLHSLCYGHRLKIARAQGEKTPRNIFSTDTCFSLLGLPAEPSPHHALIGAKMEAEGFSRLIFKKPLFEDYEVYALPDTL